jgi:hypothetical protein
MEEGSNIEHCHRSGLDDLRMTSLNQDQNGGRQWLTHLKKLTAG